jgi:2-oxo-4-hydroxy-4-carboxy-5-ureidoimidazoline decarboxylase
MAVAKTLPSISDLSSLPQDEFVAALDGLYEHSPWVAASAWRQRPFRSFAALREALSQAVRDAGPAEQIALVRAHPELAGKAVRGELTAESTREQSGAGLDQCSAEEFETLTRLNRDYGKKFGFPFIIAVRGHTRASIIEAFTRRLRNGPDQELQECVRQIDRIAAMRLQERVPEGAML